MHKIVLSISLLVALSLLSLFSEGKYIYATEILGENEHAPSKMLTKKPYRIYTKILYDDQGFGCKESNRMELCAYDETAQTK